MKTSVFGIEYDCPFAISPMGLSALAAYDGDVALAGAAVSRGTLAIMSATSLTALERVSREAGSGWFQAYFPGDAEQVISMTDRIAAAGFETLVVTVDVVVNGNREVDLRNNFRTPLKLTPGLAWQGVTHPRWLFGTALRTLRKLGMMRKSKFVFEPEADGYRCPNGQLLSYATTDRNGYRHYRSDPQVCRTCPLLASCTTNANAQRTITRHVWAHIREDTDVHRLTPWGKAIYKRRKETIERSFADAKQLHGHRYARFRSRIRVSSQCLLVAAAQNMKKIAMAVSRNVPVAPA